MAITFVQSASSGGGTVTSAPIAYGSNVTSGHLLIAVVMNSCASVFTLGVSDSQGNTWTPVGPQTGIGANSLDQWRAWYTITGTTGADTVTGTAAGASANFLLTFIAEYAWPSGLVTVDGPQLVNDLASSLNYPSLTFSPRTTNELQFVAGVINAGESGKTPNAPFTSRATSSVNYLLADNQPGSVGTNTFSATASPNAAPSGSFGFALSPLSNTLTFLQHHRGTDNQNTCAVTGLTVGSFILLTLLAGPLYGGTAATSISDGTNTWLPLITDFSSNQMSYWYCAKNQISGSATITAVGQTGGTQRMWIDEFSGQNPTSPIAAVIATGLISTPAAGPITKAYNNLTSVISQWSNSGTAQTAFDGGTGAIASGPGAGDFVGYDINLTAGPGQYTATWTETTVSANGALVLVKSLFSDFTGGIVFQQSTGPNTVASGTTLAQAYGSNLTSGSYLLAYTAVNSAGAAATATMADSAGNTWTRLVFTNSGGSNFFVFGAPNTHGAVADTVTATYAGGTVTFAGLGIMEYTGVNNASPIDVVGAFLNVGSTASYVGTPVTTTRLQDVVLGFGYYQGSVVTPGTNQTIRLATAAAGAALGLDQPAATLGTYTPSGTSVAQQYALATIALASFGAALGSGFGSGSFSANAMGTGALYGLTNQMVRQI